MTTEFLKYGKRNNEFLTGSVKGSRSSSARSRTILFITNDKQLHEKLMMLANATGQMVVRAEHAGVRVVMQATHSVAVLLDLDLPHAIAWETAELILREPDCPPLILLTRRRAEFELQTPALRGSLLSKSESPSHVLEIVRETVEMPEANQAERNAVQRAVIRSLRASQAAAPTAPTYRFWGINE